MTWEYVGFRHGYQPNYDMNNFSDQVQAHNGYQYMTYGQQQHMVLAQLQHQRAAAMMNQGGMSQAKPTESKPRLAKDEVETLEREFNKNPKPNSSLKRELADQMRVDVARINNWFQNRRAKAKQEKKTKEFEAQQAAERAASGSECAEDQSDDGGGSEFYGSSNHSQSMQPCSARFSDADDSPKQRSESPGCDDYLDNEDEDIAAANMSPLDGHSEACDDIEAPQFLQDDFQAPHFQFHPTESPAYYHDFGNSSHVSEAFRGPTSHIGITIEDHSERGNSIPEMNFEARQDQVSGLESFGHLANNESLGQYSTSMPTYHSQFLSLDTKMENIKTEDSSFDPGLNEHSVDLNHLSPTSMTQPSPTSTVDLRFKSPPSPRLDIATRRNLRRPAQLNPTAFRSCSGPKTGVDMPKRGEATSPMRRIVSATGSMPGRVQKPTLGLPRSPMFSDRKQEALLQSIQGTMSPMTPSECHNNATQFNARDTRALSSTSDEEQMYNFAQNSYFQVQASHIKTPPGTPGFRQQPRYPITTMEGAWNLVPSDDPLVTPGLGSFGSEMEFPASQSAPGYAASQPVTPSFARPAFYHPIYAGNGAPNIEYKFPDSSSAYGPESSARSSPVNVAVNFQFTQNITPQDFS